LANPSIISQKPAFRADMVQRRAALPASLVAMAPGSLAEAFLRCFALEPVR
jgi:hypothetical protein